MDYKDEIKKSRIGALGGSDAATLLRVANLGYVPNSAYERLAVAKGLIPFEEKPVTSAMAFGDFIEQSIFEHLSASGGDYESNPCWKSEKYSRKNINLICHPDIVRYDEQKKVVQVFECKATQFPVNVTKENYRAQLFVEWCIANEIAASKGKAWRATLSLVHYDTNGVDANAREFDVNRMTVAKLKMQHVFNLSNAMDIVDVFLDDFNEYYKDDEIDSQYLPQVIKDEFNVITGLLAEIKEHEDRVTAFKEKLFEFMANKGIKSIKNEQWSITRVDPTESVTFDTKAFWEDYCNKHPRVAKKLSKQFSKRTKRKGYVNIKLKKN